MMQGTHDAVDYCEKAMPSLLAQFLHANNNSAVPSLTACADNNQAQASKSDHIRRPKTAASTENNLTTSDVTTWVSHVCDGVWGSDTNPYPDEDMVKCLPYINQCFKQNLPLNTIPCAHFPSCSENDFKMCPTFGILRRVGRIRLDNDCK